MVRLDMFKYLLIPLFFSSPPLLILFQFTRPGRNGPLKTNTALLYDEDWNVLKWGAAAYVGVRRRPNDGRQQIPVELFKLHLGDLKPEEKPQLPAGLDYKKAISDFMAELWQVSCWLRR
jgi:hypothetical protein